MLPHDPDESLPLKGDVVLQVKYEIVSEEELETQRKQFHNGQLQLKIEEQTFSMK